MDNVLCGLCRHGNVFIDYDHEACHLFINKNDD